MNCDGFRQATCGHLSGELSDEARAAYEAHLTSCASCRRFLELARMTTCEHVADFLSDYLENELPAEERTVFEQHLGLCPPCVDYMRSLRSTIQAGQSLCDGEDCPPLPDELVEAILRSRPRD